ncbi:MAG: tRNA epoxyqueuosine(34) reductase QueG [Firmicutes bacterium]|nr:tRNA epoxyqueuosine(34) reductase QueG [Bacillota bacterium]
MRNGITEDKLYEYAKEKNIAMGIGNAERFEDIRDIIEKRYVPFVKWETEERIDPRRSMDNARSIICIGVSYNKEFIGEKDDRIRGVMSLGAVGEDYHKTVGRYLKEMLEYAGIEGKIFVDTGALVDREVAIRCGIGNYGENNSVISPIHGAMFFIGYALTEEKLTETGREKKKTCTGCGKCLKICPTKALYKGGFDYKRCISYITQKKGCLSEEEMKAVGKNIYGCDLCQKVCPLNSPPEKSSNIEKFFPDIEKLLYISNAEFKETYGNTAAGWRGKKILQRNAVAALGNMNDERALKLAEKFLDDEREEINHAARLVCR